LDARLLRDIADRKVLTMKWPWLGQHRACTNLLHCLKSKLCNVREGLYYSREKTVAYDKFAVDDLQYKNHTLRA